MKLFVTVTFRRMTNKTTDMKYPRIFKSQSICFKQLIAFGSNDCINEKVI